MSPFPSFSKEPLMSFNEVSAVVDNPVVPVNPVYPLATVIVELFANGLPPVEVQLAAK